MSEKRRDSKNRILRTGESQEADGRYKFRYIDANGKIVMNWIISCLIYGIVSGILCLIGIGVVLLIALAICNLTFIIIGSVKASQGNLWPYPLSIPFIK